MPELPEVETMCRGIAPLIGRRISAIERPPCERRPISIEPRIDRFHRECHGKEIVAIQRLGKRVVLWLQSAAAKNAGKNSEFAAVQAQGWPSLGLEREGSPALQNPPTTFIPGAELAIVIEPRMTGLVLLADPPTTEHLRLRIKLTLPQSNGGAANGSANHEMLFWDRRGLGTVRLFTADEMRAQFDSNSHERKLGPDALSISADQLREQFRASRRAIKVALLDQRRLAGVGNLYASEILHLAKIHPAKGCHRLKAGDWQRLHTALVAVLNAAIGFEGSTLSDGTYRNALNQSGGYQNHHRVYDLAGEACRGCKTGVVKRIVQAQRSTFFCPVCQKR